MAATVGIVLVSHSAALASGTAELAGQVGGGAVTIAAAGGTDDGRLGTSAAKVTAAVRTASAGSGGVVIVPDLGSSVLTVRALLADGDLDDVAGGLALADAPFVEGAVAAAVTAAAGGSLKDVLDAAQGARDARKL
jgi:phosphoenolpyruvate---glycerone phosphotransferase subunit DhaM